MDRLTHRTLTQIHSMLVDYSFCSAYPHLFDKSALNNSWKEAQKALEQLWQWVEEYDEYRNLIFSINKAIESRDVEYILDELQTILDLQ